MRIRDEESFKQELIRRGLAVYCLGKIALTEQGKQLADLITGLLTESPVAEVAAQADAGESGTTPA